MARGIKVRINSAGARAVLTSAGVAGKLGDMASAISASANAKASPDNLRNSAYMSEVDSSGNRARARVWTASPHGIRNNNKHNTLLKSLDAGR